MPANLIEIRAIGVVRTSVADAAVSWRRRDMVSTIEVFDQFAAGLAGIEDYSHLFVIFALDRVTAPDSLLARPRGDRQAAPVGVFAARGRNHPNAVGLAVVELLARRGATLEVRRLDAFDGTPVIDIKPYDDYDVVAAPRVPTWWRLRAMTKSEDPG